jgi:hypothetical protein
VSGAFLRFAQSFFLHMLIRLLDCNTYRHTRIFGFYPIHKLFDGCCIVTICRHMGIGVQPCLSTEFELNYKIHFRQIHFRLSECWFSTSTSALWLHQLPPYKNLLALNYRSTTLPIIALVSAKRSA